MCQSCQTWPAKFGQILLRTDTRLVFCNRKLVRTDIFFTRTTKPICNFANSEIQTAKCFVPTQLSIFYQWQSIPRFSYLTCFLHSIFRYCCICSHPEYNKTYLLLDFQQPNINQVKLLAFENRLIQDSTEFVFKSDFMFGSIIIVWVIGIICTLCVCLVRTTYLHKIY
jgi:hypothetical protein